VTEGTLEEMHWDILPHPAYRPDLAPSDFHLFGPLKETPGGKDLELTIKINVLCDGWTSKHELFFTGA
jgi:hypothetical protein